MLTSPISVTIDAVTHSLNRINQDNYGSTYLAKGDGFEVRLEIRHNYEGKQAAGQYERHVIDLKYTEFDENGLATDTQVYQHIRFKRGNDGALGLAVTAALNALSGTISTAVVGWES